MSAQTTFLKARRAGCVLMVGLFLASCARAPKFYKPNKPPVLGGTARYSLGDFEKDKAAYEQNVKNLADPAAAGKARFHRDRMITGILSEIEDVYGEFELALASNRAFFETGFDFLELGTGVATTISGPERVKTVLAAALTGTQGFRLSVDKNFFREKATEVIITAMRAARQEQRNLILGKMTKLGVAKYTFEEARLDITELFYAGTLQGALQTLGAQAGARETQAVQEEKDFTKEQRLQTLEPVSTEQLDLLDQIRARFREWYNQKNAAEAKKALQSLGVPALAEDSDETVFRKLNAEIRERSRDTTGLQQLQKAFEIP